MISTHHEFVDCLIELADRLKVGAASAEEPDEVVKKSFLKYASETPDNMACSERIEYGKVPGYEGEPEEVYGLKVRGKDFLLSDVMWQLESVEGAELIRSKHPELTTEDAKAILRMCTFILSSLEARVLRPELDDDRNASAQS
ncbi:hypothetical protein WME98_23500 [Sorangium sp. So ce296]|uniref:hypothetical protein n=1 Tax=Sorangium sp. So ce296 TaxID=3133296 RepID=UPI003F5EF0E6